MARIRWGALGHRLVLAAVVLAPPVAAQTPGQGRARANLVAAFFYTDNFYYEDTSPVAGRGALLRPEFAFTSRTSKLEVDLATRGELGAFGVPGSEDDYADGRGRLDVSWTPTYRNRIGLEGGVAYGHDPFGVERTEDGPTEGDRMDRWRESHGGARYRYGAPSARINAELKVTGRDKSYLTNQAATQYLDYQTASVDYTLSYNVTPKTAMVAGFTRSDIDFDHAFDNDDGPGGTDLDTRSGDLYQARAGARWLATAKTSGDVRVGYRQRTFESLPDVEVEGFDWQAGIQWSPSSPLLIELRTGRDEQQSYRFDANVIDQRSLSLTTRHHMTSRTRLNIGFDRIESEFHGGGRRDETRHFRLGVDYRAASWLYLVTDFGYATRQSTQADRDYDRLTATLGIGFGRPGQ